MSRPFRAMVLAAGEGRRLRPLTDEIAKPALPFVGVTVLDRLLDRLAGAGVTEAVVNLHQAPESVRRVVRDRAGRPPRVTLSDETALLLGTGGALMPVRDVFRDDDFLLVNGDCVHEIDFRRLMETHRDSGAAATLAVRPAAEPGFSALLVDDGSVVRFGVSAEGRPGERHYLSVEAVSPRLLDHLPRGEPRPVSSFGEWHAAGLRAGERFAVHESEAEWHALDTRERYLEATGAWLARRDGGPWIASDAEVDPSARLDAASAVHSACRVGGDVGLARTVLLPGAVVGRGARLDGCLVGPGAHVAPGARRHDEILVRSGSGEQERAPHPHGREPAPVREDGRPR